MATEKAAKKASTDASESSGRKKVIEAADASRIARVAYMAVLGKVVSEESLQHLSPEARKIANAIIGQKTRDQGAQEAAVKFRQWAAQNAGTIAVVPVKAAPAKSARLGKKAS